jgi:D-alanine--D-alanine ligase
MDEREKMKIAIVHGGTSAERASSTVTAGHVEAALSRLGYQTTMIHYDAAMIERLCALNPDLVWICVQGKGHGDGTVQAVLDFLGFPYTGSRTMGAAVINDKIICKELFRGAGIRTPDWQTISFDEYRSGRFTVNIGYPFVAKAPTQGYSFGIEMINGPEELPNMESVFAYDDPIFIEKFIPGHNATIGFLAGPETVTVFPPVGHALDGDKENYTLVKAGSPAPVVLRQYPESLAAELRSLAGKVFVLTRAEIYGRLDFRVSCEDGLPYVLEINAVPGLRPTGAYACGACLCGIDYDTMMETIVHKSENNRKSDV